MSNAAIPQTGPGLVDARERYNDLVKDGATGEYLEPAWQELVTAVIAELRTLEEPK